MASELFPLSVVNCGDALSSSSSDARYQYACSSGGSSGAALFATTVVHLIIITAVIFATALVYAVYRRVCARRAEYRLRGVPGATAAAAASSAGLPPTASASLAAHGALLLAAASQEGASARLNAATLAAAREIAYALRRHGAGAAPQREWRPDDLGAPPPLTEAFMKLAETAAEGEEFPAIAFNRSKELLPLLAKR
jgi:hypothetical protein